MLNERENSKYVLFQTGCCFLPVNFHCLCSVAVGFHVYFSVSLWPFKVCKSFNILIFCVPLQRSGRFFRAVCSAWLGSCLPPTPLPSWVDRGWLVPSLPSPWSAHWLVRPTQSHSSISSHTGGAEPLSRATVTALGVVERIKTVIFLCCTADCEIFSTVVLFLITNLKFS